MDLALIPPAGPLAQTNSDAQAIALWLHGRSIHSKRAYTSDVSTFQRFLGGRPFPSVGLQDVQAFADSLDDGLAPASRKRTLAAVKSLLAFCHRIGYTPYDVGAALRLPRTKGTLAERIMPREATVRMLNLEFDFKKRTVLQFLYETGSRVSELTGLDWRDVQTRENGQAQAQLFGKGGKTRVVLFSDSLAKRLEALRYDARPDDPVFQSRTGRRMSQPTVFGIVQTAARRAGLKEMISPHWLRHACASHALDNGAPIGLVKEQLGHASLDTTSAYIHSRPDDGLFNYLD